MVKKKNQITSTPPQYTHTHKNTTVHKYILHTYIHNQHTHILTKTYIFAFFLLFLSLFLCSIYIHIPFPNNIPHFKTFVHSLLFFIFLPYTVIHTHHSNFSSFYYSFILNHNNFFWSFPSIHIYIYSILPLFCLFAYYLQNIYIYQ